jgi:diguanylate cyclase (GGDEF)-like protein
MGGQDYITKPFQELEVLMRVKNQLLIYQQHQKLIEQNQRLAAEIQERLKAEAEIRRLALTDELTGLYNRRGFFFLANQQLKISQRNQMDSCLLFIDLDGLKQINDSFGHEVGDEAIANIAKMLQQVFRDSDIIARLGGDEFVIFVPICTMNSEDVLSRLQTVIDKFNQTHQYPYYLSISMGMIQCRLNSDISLERLIEKADTLMYEHKRQKRQAAANLSTHDSIG